MSGDRALRARRPTTIGRAGQNGGPDDRSLRSILPRPHPRRRDAARAVPRPRLGGVRRGLRRGRLRLAARGPRARRRERGGPRSACSGRSRSRAARRRSSGRSPASGSGSAGPWTSAPAGVMVPRLDSADQAREAVTFLRYPPDGIRGVATRVRGAGPRGRRPPGRPSPERARRRDHPDRIGRRPARRRRDRRDRRRRRPVRRPGRPVPLARHPGPVPARRLPRARWSASSPRAGPTARRPGILVYDTAVVPRHLELGFTFVGIGADAAFVAEGARAVPRGAPRLTADRRG